MATKTYSIKSTRTLKGTFHTTTGTLQELVQSFKYTLECGESYQHEKGNKKINTNPRTIKSLITNLNNAEMNRSLYGYPSYVYELEEEA